MSTPDDIRTASLRAQEERARADAERGQFDTRTDFGAYAAVKSGRVPDALRCHALADDERARDYVAQLRRFLARRGLSLEGAGLDVGCSVGAITAALGPGARGVELSRDAVDIARARYPGVEFVCGPAEELSHVPDGSLAWVHAREFYAFTRSTDLAYQRTYLELFARKLRPGGFFVSSMRNEGGLTRTFDDLRAELETLGFSRMETAGALPLRVASRISPLLDIRPLYAASEVAMSACSRFMAALPVWHLLRK